MRGMKLVLRYLAILVAIIITIYVVPGISAADWPTVFIAAAAWAAITLVIRPVLALLTLPITILSLGIFYFILNALLFWAMTLFVPGFVVSGFFPALVGSIVLSILAAIIHTAFRAMDH
jgi:putative membrane protein